MTIWEDAISHAVLSLSTWSENGEVGAVTLGLIGVSLGLVLGFLPALVVRSMIRTLFRRAATVRLIPVLLQQVVDLVWGPLTLLWMGVSLSMCLSPFVERITNEHAWVDAPQYAQSLLRLLVVVSLLWLCWRLSWGVSILTQRWLGSLDVQLQRSWGMLTTRAARVLFPLVLLMSIAGLLPLELQSFIQRHLGVVFILVSGWLLSHAVMAVEEIVHQKFDLQAPDNLRARVVHTQVRVLKRVLLTVIWFVCAASVLLLIPGVRQFGQGLLASAGVAGVVVGLAAQKSFSNIFAGLHLAFSQRVRLDDVVVVDGQWGRIEEIRLTYVIVAIWDQRRLIVPVSRMLDASFENWTHKSAELLGTVVLYADFGVDLGGLRTRLREICTEAGALWDGRVCVIQVTEVTESSMQVRALVSSSDASKCWELRCLVREQLLIHLREKHPSSLPQVRVQPKSPFEFERGLAKS